ncbi:MAG TPA: SRPBCC family protein [Nevskia sp.]|nr:SRPBCC family protein [Nevskia sp.]
MSKRKVVHDSFTIERIYPAAPTRVFKAWAKPESKARWFVGPGEWQQQKREFDFRVGGQEIVSGQIPGQVAHHFLAVYHDIADNQRIVYSYHMLAGDTPISVSLATVQIETEGTGTKLIFTEQCAFLDDYDGVASREEGTRYLLDNLGAALAAAEAH